MKSYKPKSQKEKIAEQQARVRAGFRDLVAITRDKAALQALGIDSVPATQNWNRTTQFWGKVQKEIKAVDMSNISSELSTTAGFWTLNLIRAGSSFFNRIGRKIELKSVHLKLQVLPVRTRTIGDFGRILLVYDSQSNGAVPAISDVLQDTDESGTNVTDCYSSANLNNRDRFRILADWKIPLPAITVTAGVITNPGVSDPITPTYHIERYVKLKGLITQFKADSSPAVIGDIATGALHLITYGLHTSGQEGFNVYGSARLRYFDS